LVGATFCEVSLPVPGLQLFGPNMRLQAALLLWTIEGIFSNCLRNAACLKDSKETLAKVTIPVLLAQRRIIFYLNATFCYKPVLMPCQESGSDVAKPQGKSPHGLITSIFGVFGTWHNTFQEKTMDDIGGANTTDLTWLSDMPRSLRAPTSF